MTIPLITILVLLSVSAPFGTSQSVQRRPAKPIIGFVPDADFGCGCYVYRNRSDGGNRRYIFVGPMDEPGYLNIDGETIKLKSMGGSKARRNERVGDRSWERFSVGNITARIDYLVTAVCDPDDENCESTRYSVRLAVARARASTTVRALATCGC